MRLEATVGPVTLVCDRRDPPQPTDKLFRVSVFVHGKSMGVAAITGKQWSVFNQAAAGAPVFSGEW